MSNKYKNYLNKLSNDINTATMNMMKIPPNEKNKPHYPVYEFNIKQQADLLELPNDNGFKYLLVVVDFKRYAAAQPLKNKSSTNILNAFKKIYENDENLNFPMALHTDGGSEFQNKTIHKFFASKYTIIRTSKPGRSRQNALAENFNNIFSTVYNVLSNQQELKTQKKETGWTKYIEPIVKIYNEKNRKRLTEYKKKLEKKPYPICKGENCIILNRGQKVRLKLDVPINAHNRENHTTKKFRAGDIRYTPKIYTIDKLVLLPLQPPMYQVKEKHKVLYTSEQLQLVPDDEEDDMTHHEKLEKGVYEIEKLIDKRINKRKVEYLVKWKDSNIKTWEPRKHLLEEVGSVNFKILIDDYKDNN